MVKTKQENFCDTLGKKSLRYAVLTKKGRIQILIDPSPKELRKRGKKQWHLVQAIDGQPEARQALDQVLQTVLQEMESPGRKNGDLE